MLKKITILAISGLMLGGCTLTDVFKVNNAANDTQTSPVATTTPNPSPTATNDPELKTIPSPGSGNDEKSLESDINNSVILNEDYSNIQ